MKLQLRSLTVGLSCSLFFAGFVPVMLRGQAQPERGEDYPNFDRRVVAPATPTPSGTAAIGATSTLAEGSLAMLRSRVKDLRVERDGIVGTPSFIRSTSGFLTGPDGTGANVSANTPAALPADDPYRTVKAFIDQYEPLFGHRSDVLAAARVQRDYVTAHNRLRTVIWEQHVDGVRIFEALFQAHLTARGELVNVASRLVPNVTQAMPASAAERASRLATPRVSSRSAVARAGRNIGENVTDDEVEAADAAEGADLRQRFRTSKLTDAEARYVWLPMNATTLRLCWEIICTSKSRGHMYRVLVDSDDGEVHVRQSLTQDIGPATYRVFTSDSPSPFSPGHATPSSVQPPTVQRQLVTLSALNTTASPNGWIDDGVIETRGNNVDAHTDVNADNVADLPRPQATGANRVFDPPLDLTQEPSTYRDAAVVNLFYWCNWMHDRLYELGFTEAAGNFQNNNFGRGGVGNDALQADAQDGSGTNNANFSTPPDGSPGRMQMFIWTGATPDRDGDFDMEVVLHEYTHGLSNRLVGGGVGISALVSAGMGEGWSDFYGITLLAEPTDDVDGSWPRGGYSRYLSGGTFTQNYYFGGRRYPYSTNLNNNPLTFKDIDPTQASSHAGIPVSPIVGSTADEVHNMGEVWCVTLWEVRANLIKKHGFATGNQLTLQLVTDAMKLSPANPNFLQSRDAIIQADLVGTGGANRSELWAAFAKRGMGASAYAPASSTAQGVFESFDLPDALDISPTAPALLGGMVGGPFAPTSAAYALTNTSTAPLNWTVTKSAAWLDVSPAGGTLVPGANVTVNATPNSTANAFVDGVYSATLTFTNTTNNVVQARALTLDIQPVTTPIFTEGFESGTLDATKWVVTGTSTFRTRITTSFVPHSGARHLTMDSSTTSSLARNEATLTLNLTGEKGIRLKFWAKSFGDEASGPPTSPFTSGADFDGVAISVDGTTWYEVQGLRSTAVPAISSEWTQYTVDLDPFMAARGLSFSSTFKIRFNQYDDNPIATDGIAIDDIQVLRIVGAASPAISTPPASQTANVGGNVTFSVAASSIPAPTYQWSFNGVPIPGATQPALTITNAQITNAGSYTVTVTNMFGAVTSAAATLSGAAAVPAISQQPAAATVTAGQGATFTVSATGTAPLSYQWRRNGFPITGATAASFTLGSSSRSDADYYDVLVGAGLSVATSQPARLAVAPTSYPALVAPSAAWDLQPETTSGVGYAFAELADGRSYIGGLFTKVDGSVRTGIARVKADGISDTTFVPPEIDGTVRSIAVQSDGKVVVGGEFIRVNGLVRNRIVRLNPDGSVDASFDSGTGATGASASVLALVALSDGKILVGGSFLGLAGGQRSNLGRLNADGSLDTSFQTRGMNSTVNSIARQPDGKLVAGGSFTSYTDSNGAVVTRNRLARLNSDGTLDTAFVPTINSTVNAVGLQSTGRIIIGGSFTSANSTTVGRVARLNSDGTIEATFTTANGSGFGSTVNTLAVQSDDRVVVGGSFTTLSSATANFLARLTSEGARDTTFLNQGMSSTVNGVMPTSAGKLLVGGFFSSYFAASGSSTSRANFARLNADGTLDSGYSFAMRGVGSINGVVVLPDNKVLITGFFTLLRGASVPTAVARINSDGSVDTQFNALGSGSNSNVYAAALQPDGRIFITGAFTSYGGATANRIARLMPDGKHDPTFNAGAGLSSSTYTVTVMPGGRVFAGGAFTTAQGLARTRVAVFNPDGSLDTSFNPGSGANSTVYASVLQPDGKLIISGLFTTYNGTARNRIARLNPNGSLDTTFNIGSGADSSVYSLALQADGKVLIGGIFASVNGTTRLSVARLNSDGSVDNAFVPPSLAGTVQSLLLQPDGKVVIRGAFTAFGTAGTDAFLARLNSDGSADATFGSGGFAPSTSLPSLLAMRDNGQLVTSSNGIDVLAATQSSGVPTISAQPVALAVAPGGSATFSVTAAGSGLTLKYRWQFNGTPISGATNSTLALNNVQAANAGNYSVVVTTELGSITSSTVGLTVIAETPRAITLGDLRGSIGTGPAALFGAFTVEGSTPKQMLIRAIGPTLGTFGVPNVMADPQLEIVNATTGVVVATNDDWGLAANAAAIQAASSSVGAFPLSSTSKDAVVLATFAPGTYRLRIAGANGTTGVAMAGIYEADSVPRFVYLALRGPAGLGDNSLIAAFVVSGNATGQYLIRAVGSSSLFSAGMVGNPVLSVYSGNTLLATNDDWGNAASSPDIAAATVAVGAQPLLGNSSDSALLLTLAPGGYTAQVTNAVSGLVLFELFAVDANRASSFAPAIISQPTPMSVSGGQSAFFGVAAIGKPAMSYQWRKNGASIAGATGPTVIIPSSQLSDIGAYDVIVSNAAGTATSASANLTVTGITHGADSNRDGAIGLFELTRAIQLYNTRNGTVRTGAYSVQDGTEDGFAPDPSRAATASVTLTRYHSADTPLGSGGASDGKLNLTELTRVIELYNYRSGTVRTGQYHIQPGTEDGFAPGP